MKGVVYFRGRNVVEETVLEGREQQFREVRLMRLGEA
jgi:hypothetical protein